MLIAITSIDSTVRDSASPGAFLQLGAKINGQLIKIENVFNIKRSALILLLLI